MSWGLDVINMTMVSLVAVVLSTVTGCGQAEPVKVEMVPVCADGSKPCISPQMVPVCQNSDPCDLGPDVYCC